MMYTYANLPESVRAGTNTQIGRLLLSVQYAGGSTNFEDWTLVGDPMRAVDKNIEWEGTPVKFTPHCVCGHQISYIHFVQHKTTKALLAVGSTCVRKFGDAMGDKADQAVYALNHPNRTQCIECDKTVTPLTLMKYCTGKKPYHVKCLNSKFKKCWECRLWRGYSCVCPPVCKHCSKALLDGCQCKFAKCLDCPEMINRSQNPRWVVRCGPCYHTFRTKAK